MDSPCKIKTLNVRGLSYNLRHWGDDPGAPVVFLLHGLLDTGASFAPMVEALQGNWQLIAPDWRGHGDTEEDPRGYWFPDYLADLDTIIKHTAGEQSVRLVSHSMGATVASLYAGLRPERVSHLVCLDALNVPARTAAMVPERYRSWLDAQVEAPDPKTYADVAELSSRIRRRYPELKPQHIERLAQDWSRPLSADDPQGRIRLANDPRHFVASPYGFIPEHAMAVWAQVTAPVFCLDGGSSPVHQWVPQEDMQKRRAAFKNLRRDVLPDCGHMLHLEQPQNVATHIEAFLLE